MDESIGNSSFTNPGRMLTSPLWLGQLLLRKGLVTQDDLSRALAEQEAGSELRLGELLVRNEAIDEATLAHALGEQFGLAVVHPAHESFEREALGRLSHAEAAQLQALPVRFEDGRLLIALPGPPTPELRDVLTRSTGESVQFAVAPAHSLSEAIELWYRSASPVRPPERVDSADAPEVTTVMIGPPTAVEPEREPASDSTAHSTEEVDNDGRSSRSESDLSAPDAVVAWLLDEAVEAGASVVHLEHQRGGLQIRYRVDGVMRDDLRLPLAAGEVLIRRVLLAAGLRTADPGPQSGCLPTGVSGERIDLHVAMADTLAGPKVVLRFPGEEPTRSRLDELALPDATEAALRQATTASRGLVVVAGPPKSGRSTTLRALLEELDPLSRSITTVEEEPGDDPPSGAAQLRLRPESGLTAVDGVRAALALDPDVVLIDAPSDAAVIAEAMDAALRDHLVLLALEAETADDALALLTETVGPFLVAAGVILVVGQRLVERATVSSDHEGGRESPGRGCGVVAVAEAIAVTDDVRESLIVNAKSTSGGPEGETSPAMPPE